MAATAKKSTGYPVTDTTQSTQIARGTIGLSGNYGGGATNGDTLDLSKIGAQSSKPPVEVEIYEEPAAGTAPTGYKFLFAKGTTQKNGQLVVLQGGAAVSTPQAQITQGAAYPAGLITAANAGYLKYKATFLTGI